MSAQLDAADKSAIEAKIPETIAWLDGNQNAEKEEYEEKQQAMKAAHNPGIQTAAAANGGGMLSGGVPGGMPDMNDSGFPGAGIAATPEKDADPGPRSKTATNGVMA